MVDADRCVVGAAIELCACNGDGDDSVSTAMAARTKKRRAARHTDIVDQREREGERTTRRQAQGLHVCRARTHGSPPIVVRVVAAASVIFLVGHAVVVIAVVVGVDRPWYTSGGGGTGPCDCGLGRWRPTHRGR